MIATLRGTLAERDLSGRVVIEVAGVGYGVIVTPGAASALGELDAEVFVYVHHHRRDDIEQLFGFVQREERTAFEALLGAHGVGPALALAILGVHDPFTLRQVVLADDVDALCLVPGVGKKTAARLLIELKSRLDVPDLDPVVSSAPGTAAGVAGRSDAALLAARSDVRDALAGLGYGPDEVLAVLRELPDSTDTSVLLREALALLAVR
jgi:Holliday junction DNA helicase RuvA